MYIMWLCGFHTGYFAGGGRLFRDSKLMHVKQTVSKAHPSRGGLGARRPREFKKNNYPEIEPGGFWLASNPGSHPAFRRLQYGKAE